MYQISDELNNAQMHSFRDTRGRIVINSSIEFTNETIINFELEDNIVPESVLTIGTAISNTFKFSIFSTEEVVLSNGDLVEPYLSMSIGDVREEVPLGKFYIDEITKGANKYEISCTDKMCRFTDMYVSKLTYPNTIDNIVAEVCEICDIDYDINFNDITIDKRIDGYTCREIFAMMASFNGANAKLDRNETLVFVGFDSESISIPKSCYYLPLSLATENYELGSVCAYFGNGGVGIHSGNTEQGNILGFTNMYVTEANIGSIYDNVKGLNYTPTDGFEYIGFLNIEAGDLVTLTDEHDIDREILVTNHTLTYDGGLKGKIVSIGESASENSFIQNKLSNKKSLTELNIELGNINSKVLEVETDLIPSTVGSIMESYKKEYETYMEQTKDHILTEVSETYVTQDDLNEMNESISSTVEQTKDAITIEFTKTTNEIIDNQNEFEQTVRSRIEFTEEGLELGKSDSAFKAKLDNEKLAFTEDDEEIAYISNKKLYITDTEITNSLRLGNYIFTPRKNGNTSLIWIDK